MVLWGKNMKFLERARGCEEGEAWGRDTDDLAYCRGGGGGRLMAPKLRQVDM